MDITVTFDGVADHDYAAHLLADGIWVPSEFAGPRGSRMAGGNLADLGDLDDLARTELAQAIEHCAETGRPGPKTCAITTDDDEGWCGIEGVLRDSETTEAIGPATPAQMVASLRTVEGHIMVDGRKVYVS